MATCRIYVGNTGIVEITGFESVVDGTPINNATVTFTVKEYDPDTGEIGDTVSGQSFPATMSYVADSDGNYRGILEHDLALVDGENYVAVIDADGGANRQGHWEFAFKARTRRAE